MITGVQKDDHRCTKGSSQVYKWIITGAARVYSKHSVAQPATSGLGHEFGMVADIVGEAMTESASSEVVSTFGMKLGGAGAFSELQLQRHSLSRGG
eukprot:1160298-Pelagomonas_calceolata.AAC.5